MRVLHPPGGSLCELAILKNMKMFMQLWNRYYHRKIAVARSSQITFCRQVSQAGKRARSQCSATKATSNTAVKTINHQQHQPTTTINHQQPSTTNKRQTLTLGHCQQPAKARATINHNHHVDQQTATESERGIFLLISGQSES